MAPPRTFDYELLRQLLEEHPEWPHGRYAAVLTEDQRRRNPQARRVRPAAVSRAISQYRGRWAEEGQEVPPRHGAPVLSLLPPPGSVAPNQRMATELRYLRELSHHRAGRPPVTDNQRILRHLALKWEAGMRANREIVDLSDRGIVYVRPARDDELGPDGELVELAAWAVPGGQVRSRRQSIRMV